MRSISSLAARRRRRLPAAGVGEGSRPTAQQELADLWAAMTRPLDNLITGTYWLLA